MAEIFEMTDDSLSQIFVKSILECDDPTIDSLSSSQKDISPGLNIKYKTEKCRYWLINKKCPFGKSCAFAHENWEIREKNNPFNYKTKHCNNFSMFGVCKYGDRCQFKHEVRKVRKVKTPCSFWNQLDNLQAILPISKRLKVFENFSEDSFEKINWAYKKPRMYTI